MMKEIRTPLTEESCCTVQNSVSPAVSAFGAVGESRGVCPLQQSERLRRDLCGNLGGNTEFLRPISEGEETLFVFPSVKRNNIWR